ncbi:MAG: chemotaxis protein CheB [Terriglobia bacterium]
MKSHRAAHKSGPETTSEKEQAATRVARGSVFPIVGIGASAGGLEAFTHLLEHLPRNPGMALVFVQHLAPQHESALTELLARATRIPVSEAKEGVKVEPDRVYVIPPNANMAIRKGRLRLTPRAPDEHHLPIDYFLRSLAEELGSRAIGVILSGTASDGALGLKAIKAEGGVTFAQDESSAKYGDMPRNAAAGGSVDFVLPPEGIARELVRVARHPFLLETQTAEEKESATGEEGQFQKIFALLRTATGVDFTYYKHSAINRRIKRRMVLHKIQELADYVKHLEENRDELEALYQDILIHVTGFFRDPQVFDALKDQVFPSLAKNRRTRTPIRIWVPGCSTGEEVYSIAMALLEFLGAGAAGPEVQIFGTDISEMALGKARAGVYPENVTTDVSTERLRRFFVKTTHGYQILKSIREMCVFARQDVAKDPPFSHLDLISCRNLLIYLATALQKKVIPIFHYALNPTGFLLLGTSETLGAFADHFSLMDKKYKIYAKKPTTFRPTAVFASSPSDPQTERVTRKAFQYLAGSFDVQKEADRILLSRFAPAGVLINSDQMILQFRGRTGAYLEPTPGEASLSLPKMVREGLLVDLRGAFQKAKRDDVSVRKEGVPIKSDVGVREVNLEVLPIRGPSPAERYYLVLFEDVAPETKDPQKGKAKGAKPPTINERNTERVSQLKNELAQTKSTLQSIIEEQDTTNEELKSANEEILSSNEELQSTNEELETAKEELQSTNEELTTLNEELQNRNLELSVANNDLLNLLGSVNVPILMLGNDLRVRRFTSQAERLLNLIPTDVGRPINDIKANFTVPDLEELITEAIDSVSIKEREVEDREGFWYTMRIRPYRTAENRLEGAVITWIDITALKKSLADVTAYAQAIVDSARESLLVLDGQLQVKTANQTFYDTFRVSPEETENRLLYELGNGQWNIPRLRTLLEEILPMRTVVHDFEVDHEFPHIGRRHVQLNARKIDRDSHSMVLLAIEDLTELRRAGESLRELSSRMFSVQHEERQRLARELHDTTAASLVDLTTNLSLVSKSAHSLDGEAQQALERASAVARQCSSEVRTLAYLLHPPVTRDLSLRSALRWYVEGFSERSGVQVQLDLPEDLKQLPEPVELVILGVVQEALSNVHRHSGSSTASLRITHANGEIAVEVSDRGRGMPPEIVEGNGKPGAKAGLGMRGMIERVQQERGRLEILSGGKGTTVRATLPLGGT